MNKVSFVPFTQVDLENGFWAERYALNKRVSVENVKLRFEETGRFDALRFNFLKTGRRPHIFYDSDVAKWMEAVAYLAAKDPDSQKDNLALCEELIDCMEKAQREDGYLNSAHQQLTPETIFRNRGDHELYCAGHLAEAAVAYHIATGKDRFLKITEKVMALVRRVFMEEDSAAFATPGHEEIELALMTLYRHTGKKEYFELAKFFLEKRGNNPKDTLIPHTNAYSLQDDTDIYHLKEANGHCVRALYFYLGIADLVKETGDETLLQNLRSVFEDIAERKMYITGGVGATYRSESFTSPFDLPNQTAYNESCAAIALFFFALRMRELDRNAVYGDVAERVLYNGLLSSTSLDGKSFFYENPLEINLSSYDRETAVAKGERERLPITTRLEAFDCSCCPPNVNRFFARFSGFLALEEDGRLTVEQYVSARIVSSFGQVNVREEYAVSGKVTLSSENYSAETLAFRLPLWSKSLTVVLNGKEIIPKKENGYAVLAVPSAFVLELDFHIAPVLVSASARVRENAGKVALTYGPLVYCLEGIDNGEHLWELSLPVSSLDKAVKTQNPLYRLPDFTLQGCRLSSAFSLYFPAGEETEAPCPLVFRPYFTFANRGKTDMSVWVRKK